VDGTSLRSLIADPEVTLLRIEEALIPRIPWLLAMPPEGRAQEYYRTTTLRFAKREPGVVDDATFKLSRFGQGDNESVQNPQ